MNIGILLTEFPNQTSISMWRVGDALRKQGHSVNILSTRKSKLQDVCHQSLQADVESALYAWPPNFGKALLFALHRPNRILACLQYIFSLDESGFVEKLKLIPMIASAIKIAKFSKANNIEHVLVHSLANGAHLINLSYLSGGPNFSLRLGGDLEAYGKDHKSKFSNALFTLPASLNNRDQILEYKLIDRKKILTTWLGVDTEKFTPRSNSLKTDILQLVTVARLNPAKGHIYALESLLELQKQNIRFHYTIAGSGPYENTLKSFVNEHNLDEHVTFTGHVDESKAIVLLQSADIFLLNSIGIGEASPVSLIEAMACGLPCISSIIGGTPQIITDGKDGILIPQKDVDALTSSIAKLATDLQLCKEIGKNARTSAIEYFSCKQVAAAFTDAITTITSNSEFDLEKLSPIVKKLNKAAT